MVTHSDLGNAFPFRYREGLAGFCCGKLWHYVQYIPRKMHTIFALLCFVVVIHWLIFPYPSGLLHWHCGNLTIAPVPAKQPWWIWVNTLCEFIMNDCITTTKQSTTKPCAYFLGYTVWSYKIPERIYDVTVTLYVVYHSGTALDSCNWVCEITHFFPLKKMFQYCPCHQLVIINLLPWYRPILALLEYLYWRCFRLRLWYVSLQTPEQNP